MQNLVPVILASFAFYLTVQYSHLFAAPVHQRVSVATLIFQTGDFCLSMRVIFAIKL